MRNNVLSVAAGAAAAAASALYYGSFTRWQPALYALSAALYALAAGLLTARFTEKKKLPKSVIAGAVFAVVFFALTFLINNVILGATRATLAAAIMSGLTLAFFALYYGILSRGKQKSKLPAALAFVLSVALTLCSANGAITKWYYQHSDKRTAPPQTGKEIAEMEKTLVDDADFYVAPDGSDDNDGSFAHPLATIEKARDLVRAMEKTGKDGITVALKAGEYRVTSVVFTAEDSGAPDCPVTYCACGDDEVILNGGMTLDPALFQPVTDEAQLARLNDEAKTRVKCLDLGTVGITVEDYGKLYAIGTYHTAAKYTGDTVGPIYAELFCNDARMSLARYPDEGWLYLKDNSCIVRDGVHCLSGPSIANPDWDSVTDPESEVYRLPEDVAERIAGWKTVDDVWCFNYFSNDWADASAPIKLFDAASREMQLQYTAFYGQRVDRSPYYFYNCFEELTAPGEWYLDRAANVLYLFPPEDFDGASLDLSLTTQPILLLENADHLTFSSLTLKGTRGDAVSITGSGNTLRGCVIKNVGGNAVVAAGTDNLVTACEITRTGMGGITLTGGDTETLTPGNNRADNNLIHDWAEICQTYQPAVTLNGAGNICSHNEIYNSAHEAVTYSGNNHLIEYNQIHHVCLRSNDAGAIYAGASWIMYGNVIRYNCVYDLGGNGYRPNGIYMDDALSGQTICGNLLVNVPMRALHLGGGRDLTVYNNIIVNTNDIAIQYDARAYNIGWFTLTDESNPGGMKMTRELLDSPRNTDAWKEAFPQMQRITEDFNATEDPGYVSNPAYSRVTGNLIVNGPGEIGSIDERVYRFSDVSGNAVYKMNALKKLFVDPDNGDYTLRDDAPVFDEIPGFEPLPLSEIGRYYPAR